MVLKRGLLGIGLGSVCVLSVACGNTADDSHAGTAAAAGVAGVSAAAGSSGAASGGDTSTQGGGSVGGGSVGGGSVGGSSVGGGSNAGTSSTGDAGSPGDGGDGNGQAGAPDQTGGTGGASGGSVGAGGNGVGGSNGGSGGVTSSGGSAGAGGSGGGVQAHSSKLDVLLVIDNSVSMADKQSVLEATLPAFLSRLTNPLCVDTNGLPVATQPASVTVPCITGKREFTANDIHIGVVSTSLGAHGGSVCSMPAPSDTNPTLDDRGELLGKLRTGLNTWQSSGFLSWDPSGVTGSASATGLVADLTAEVVAAGDDGCGYEAPLEAMYRFLIDPEPPDSVIKDTTTNQTVRQGTDATLLAERAAFLRPDSAVAILALSDENDCSIQDFGVGWFVGANTHMPKATVACATNANDPCCRSCAQNETTPPAGCVALSVDANCAGAPTGTYNTWDNLNDSLNLRCFHQKERFGFDLLYPTTRYSSGLTDLMIPNNAGTLVKNPLFYDSNGVQTRSPSLVTLSVMVGVPWQDLATTASVSSGKVVYLDAAGLSAQGRWPILLGNPNSYVDATDPLMVESIAPRTGTNPVTGSALAPATSQNPTQNPINGHEQNIPDNADLQYACIFQLPLARVCANGDSECDCSASTTGDATAVTTANSPVCQPPTGGPAGTTQYYAKAYPGLRELQVVHDLDYRGVPASICPKTLKAADPDFGYTPAFDALLKRVAACLN